MPPPPSSNVTKNKFCTYNLDITIGDTFNLQDFLVSTKGLTVPIDFSKVIFYTIDRINWHLSDFNAGKPVTAVAADAAGDPGKYRIFVRDLGETDDHITIRVFKDKAESELAQKISATGGCSYGRKPFVVPPPPTPSIVTVFFDSTLANGNTILPSASAASAAGAKVEPCPTLPPTGQCVQVVATDAATAGATTNLAQQIVDAANKQGIPSAITASSASLEAGGTTSDPVAAPADFMKTYGLYVIIGGVALVVIVVVIIVVVLVKKNASERV